MAHDILAKIDFKMASVTKLAALKQGYSYTILKSIS